MGRGEQSGLQGASALFDRRRNRRGANALERYFAYGVRPTEARAFLEQGVEARIAGELVRHGIGAEEARAALGAEIDYEALVRWLDAGFSVEEAAKWRAAGIRDGAAARQWIEAGVSPEQASSYEERRRAAGP